MRNGTLGLLTLLWSLLLPLGGGTAQELRVGFKATVDSADPHQLYTPNRNVDLHVYEALIWQDSQLKPQPWLAESWRLLNPTTWEFKLRDGVKFHDGSPLTADDVIFSIRRAQTLEGSSRTYRIYMRDVAAMEATDSRTLVIHTPAPAPLLLHNLATLGIVSSHAAREATEADFNGGRAAVGTGAYRWIKLIPSDQVVLERNPNYWGQKPAWSRVVIRFVANDSARVAGLLAGDLDVIDSVPPSLFDRVANGERTQLLTAVTTFSVFLHLDQKRERTPFATGADGQPLARNPLLDLRVRKAMTMALNRTAIAERAMEGGAVPLVQYVPEGIEGYDPDVKAPPYDPAAARRLLAEAGFDKGFGLTVGCTNDRYAGDAKVCQTVAQMFSAVGIRTQVDALPSAVFFRRANVPTPDPDFSASMAAFAVLSGTGGETMTNLSRSYDTTRGIGSTNRGRYSNPALDTALAAAEAELDPAKREMLIRRATELAMNDVAIIPIFALKASWGLRKGLTMKPRADQYTYATEVMPAP